jgi:hypothetical protein
MNQKAKNSAWLLVARNILHLQDAKSRSIEWWCVPRAATPGDRCFLYKPLRGVVLYFEVLALKPSEGFCDNFVMATADVKILRTFAPPITNRDLRNSPVLRQMAFVRRSCQGKQFLLETKATKAILDIFEAKRRA